MEKIRATRITPKLQRAMLIQEVQNLECEIEHAESRIPEALRKIKELKPTKKEIEEEGLQDLFDIYLYPNG
jgi:hypothetical protein